MTDLPSPQWTPFAMHPRKSDTLRLFRLAPLIVLGGPAMWSFLILAVSFGLTDVSTLFAAGFIIAQMAFILRGRWEVTTQRIATDVFRSRFGPNSMRTFWLSFCFLGWALAYGSAGFDWCVGATVLGVTVIELRSAFLARRFSNAHAQELLDDCIKTTNEGTLFLETAGPSLAGTDLGTDSLWVEKFGLWFLAGAPLLAGLAFSGAGDSAAGLIMTGIGLFFYSASMGNWVASRVLRRAISNLGIKA